MIVNGVASVVKGWSGAFRYSETGYVHNYAFVMAASTIAILGYYIFR